MTLSSGGCKVPWALRGGTGNAALASASGRLAGGIQTANPPTDNGDCPKDFINHRRPPPERKSKFSLRLVLAELCGFHRGDEGGEGIRDDCVDGDDIFDTGGTPENIVTTVTIVTSRLGCA